MTAWSAGVICTIFGVFVREREWGGKCLFFDFVWLCSPAALAVGLEAVGVMDWLDGPLIWNA
jgi:hypothetical protein